MATIVSDLPAALLKSNKLIAQVDEGHGVTLAAQLEFEETTVERQRLVNISYLQRNMIEAYNARSSEVSHHNLLCVEIKWVTLSQVASGCISESLRGSQGCPLSGVKRTSVAPSPMSAFDGGFNRSTQHLLILLEKEVCDGGDCTDMVHVAAECRALGALEERSMWRIS